MFKHTGGRSKRPRKRRNMFSQERRLFSLFTRQTNFGWNTVLDNLMKYLKRIKKEYFYQGTDSLLYKEEGWVLENDQSNKVLRGVTMLYSSGIPQFWRQFLQKSVPSLESYRPKKLQLNSHLMTIFFVQNGGLSAWRIFIPARDYIHLHSIVFLLYF